MAISYVIDVERQLLISTIVGPCTADDLEAARKVLVADPRWSPAFSSITDLSRAEPLLLTPQEIQFLARTSPGQPHRRRAIVASRDLQFGIARMYATRAIEENLNFRVFRTVAEAEEWLGVPLNIEPAEETGQSGK